MNAEAAMLLGRIVAAPLFERVGEPIDDPQVVVVADWAAAMAATHKNASVNFGTRIINRAFARAIAERGEDWFKRHS